MENKIKYNGRKYSIKRGQRGGAFITVKGKKKYINSTKIVSQKGGDQKITSTELSKCKYSTGERRVVLPSQCGKHLFIEKVIEQIILKNPENTYIAPWETNGKDVKIIVERTSDGIKLKYDGQYPIKKDGQELILPNPNGSHSHSPSLHGIVGTEVTFGIKPPPVTDPAELADAGWGSPLGVMNRKSRNMFLGKGTITSTLPKIDSESKHFSINIVLNVDYTNAYYNRNVGGKTIRDQIQDLLRKEGYSEPFSTIHINSRRVLETPNNHPAVGFISSGEVVYKVLNYTSS